MARTIRATRYERKPDNNVHGPKPVARDLMCGCPDDDLDATVTRLTPKWLR